MAEFIYHLVQKSLWENKGATYFPPTYSQDGFIHCTKKKELLIGIGNQFYKSVEGEFLCLVLDTFKLKGEVRYEAAAAVGELQPDTSEAALFPHLYGPIDFEAVVEVLPIHRLENGTFLEIIGLRP